MKVGDLVEFFKTGLLATITEINTVDELDPHVWVRVHGDVHFPNPTSMTVGMLERCTKRLDKS